MTSTAGESSGGEDTGKSLKTWWANFKAGKGGQAGSSGAGGGAAAGKGKEVAYQPPGTITQPTEGKPVFSMPLSEAITYASITISTPGPDGTFYVWGVVPTVVARCGRYLKENATEVEGTFRVSGSSKRMKEIQNIFDTPPKYGKYIDFGAVQHTSHDIATLFRRFLTQMPEPVVPDAFYHEFRETYNQYLSSKEDDTSKEKRTVEAYSALIKRLPIPNKYLLLYVLDLLNVFEKKSEKNLMTAANLAVIFQPGILSHPDHRMLPSEHGLSQNVLEFLVCHVDDFSPLLESRLKENPYRRKHLTKDSSNNPSSSSSRPSRSETSPPLSPASSKPSRSTTAFAAAAQQASGRPSYPPRATRLSDTMIASDSDEDFPGEVVVRMGDVASNQQKLLNRSKSTSSSMTKKKPGARRVSGSREGVEPVPTNSPHGSLGAGDGSGGRGTPTGLGVGAGVRRRSTAPSRRVESGGGSVGRRGRKIVEEEVAVVL